MRGPTKAELIAKIARLEASANSTGQLTCVCGRLISVRRGVFKIEAGGKR